MWYQGQAPLYGHFTSLLPNTADGYLYVYAVLNNTQGLQRGMALARAPIGSISQNTTYQFYLPASKTWQKYPPPSINADTDLLGTNGINSDLNIGTGDIFWSPFHKRYLMVYMPDAQHTTPGPTDPWYVRNSTDLMNWSAPNVIWQNVTQGSCANYAGHA